jgi:hypothetical protein
MLLRNCLSDFEIVPVSPVIIGITKFLLSATSPLQTTAIPTAHASSFSLQQFPYFVSYSKYNCLLYQIYFLLFLALAKRLFFST